MLTMYPDEESVETPSREDVSQMVWAWGQFIAHDMVKSPEGKLLEKQFSRWCGLGGSL